MQLDANKDKSLPSLPLRWIQCSTTGTCSWKEQTTSSGKANCTYRSTPKDQRSTM